MSTTVIDKLILKGLSEETGSKPILVWNQTTRRVHWQKSPIDRIAALEAKLDSDNNFKFIPDPGYSFNAGTRVLTMNAAWIGTIEGVDYTNAAEQIFPAIPLSASGYSRIDLIVFRTDATFERIAGTQSLFTPVAPAKPVNTLEATFLTVGDGVINVPSPPKPKAPVTSVNGLRGDVVIPKATDTVRGTVKINTPTADPVVYVKETTDNLLDAKANFFLDIKTITGISYNVIIDDILNQLVYNGTLAMNVIIPNNSVVAFPIGTIFYTLGTSTGIVTASGAAGVTLNLKAGLSLSAIQNEVRQYTKIGVNTWSVRGDLNLGAVTQTELSYLQGATSNLQAQINAKTALSSGIANRLMMWLNATQATVSRIWDTGTYLGIGTVNSPTKDITLGNQANREIGIEESENTAIGRDLITKAGRTINYLNNVNFNSLSQPDGGYSKMAYSPATNNVYAARGVYATIVRRLNSTGVFNSYTSPGLSDICYYNGDLYGCSNLTGLVYKQTAETGAWVSLGFPVRGYNCITITQSGDLYLGVSGGDIYKQVGLTGSLNALGETNRAWSALTSANNGDVYAGVVGSWNPLFKQTGGSGSFQTQSFSAPSVESVYALTITITNNLYVIGGNSNGSYAQIFKQTNLSGAYPSLEQAAHYYLGLTSDLNGNVYASAASYNTLGNIYFQNNNVLGTPNLDGGTKSEVAGTGKGTGKSRWNVFTGQKTGSGTDMQIETKRLEIDENGNVMLFTDKIFADNTAAIAGGLPVKTIYWTPTGEMRITI
jgi:hypothetical protein